MTKEQHETYKSKQGKLEPTKIFLEELVSKKQVLIVGKAGCRELEFMRLPPELQKRIVEVIEQWVDEKQKELDEI